MDDVPTAELRWRVTSSARDRLLPNDSTPDCWATPGTRWRIGRSPVRTPCRRTSRGRRWSGSTR